MTQTQLKAKPRSRTLLVVDDREANLVAMEALLGDGDWQVHTVNSGEAALRALLELDVELVLLDVQMPGMDGFEVARLMRGSPHTRYTPIIFVSAIAHTRDSVLRGYATGAVDFILKPFDPQVLKHKINTLLSHEHNRRDLQLLSQQCAEHLAVHDRGRNPLGSEVFRVVVQLVPVPGGTGVGDHVRQRDGALQRRDRVADGHAAHGRSCGRAV